MFTENIWKKHDNKWEALNFFGGDVQCGGLKWETEELTFFCESKVYRKTEIFTHLSVCELKLEPNLG